MDKEGFSNELINAIDEIINDAKWQKIGKVDELSKKKNFILYPDLSACDGEECELVQIDNIVVFCVGDNNDEFYAIDCACPHEGMYVLFICCFCFQLILVLSSLNCKRSRA